MFCWSASVSIRSFVSMGLEAYKASKVKYISKQLSLPYFEFSEKNIPHLKELGKNLFLEGVQEHIEDKGEQTQNHQEKVLL